MLRKLVKLGLAAIAAGLMSMAWQSAHAIGTPAGTSISNAATVNYSVNNIAAPPVTSTVTITVDEIIRVRVTAPVASTPVTPNSSNQVLTFQLTNTGNGSEAFFLVVNRTLGGDNFDPAAGSAGSVFYDSNNNGVYDGPASATPDLAVPVVGAAPQLTLNADQVMPIFVVSNIPAGPTNGQTGTVSLTAQSATTGAMASGAGTTAGTGAAAGTILAGAGTGGNDAVVGAGPGGAADSGADDAGTGTYIIAAVTVTVSKVVFNVTNPLGTVAGPCNVAGPPAGCSAFVPGTVIEYLVTVTVNGNGTAQAVTMTDNVPPNTTWLANSIRVGATTGTLAARTDTVDGDNGSCSSCGNATGTVIVNFGDVVVTGTTVTNLVAYKVTIN